MIIGLIIYYISLLGKSEVAGRGARRWLLALLGGAKGPAGRPGGRKALCFEFLFEGPGTENVVCARRFGLLS